MLSFEQLEECHKSNKQIDWHDEYHKKWCDAPGPLTIIGVSTMDLMIGKRTDRYGFIQYLCSNQECRVCTDESLVLRGHHKVIKMNGLDAYGRMEFKESKRRTTATAVDQPVFKNV